MRQRPSARIIVLDEQDRVLLLKFVFKKGVYVGKDFWATPGGEVNPGETFEDCAKRELFEETGIEIAVVGQHIDERRFVLPLPDGENVMAHEKFFVVKTINRAPTSSHQTVEESEVIEDSKWWQLSELRSTTETVFPENLADLLSKAL